MGNLEKQSKATAKDKVFNISYLVLSVLILLTLGITYNFYRSAQSKDIIRFGNQVNRINASIENRIKLYTAMLKGGRGFIETSSDLNRERFSAYISSLDLPNRYPGIQGIGFSRYFPASQKENLSKEMKLEGYSDFKIFPEGERSVYSSIIYIEPYNERNKIALGYDMFSEATRREAMERARDSGDISASGKVALLQERDEESPSGFLIYLPVYTGGVTPNLPEQREQNLRGFVYSPFRARNFLNEIYESFPEKDVKIRLYDQQKSDENLLAETAVDVSPRLAGMMDSTFTATQEIQVGGRKWIVQYSTLPVFAEQSSVGWTPLILLCGIGFSFLLFGMTYWEAASRAKVQRSAAKLLELQKEKDQLFDDEKKARQTAEQANRTKDEFIAVVSHELKTPLNAIAGWTRILKTEDVSGQTKDLALQKIDKNLRTQAGLVEQLLNYSEIISGTNSLQLEKLNFTDIFNQSCAEIAQLAGEKRIEFVKENNLQESLIVGDREKLKLVLVNLLSNAVKFTQTGGKIKASVRQYKDGIDFQIEDNGRGISADFLPHVFENYKQAETPTTRNFGGLGLGLTIAKHIINLHNGTISAASEGKNKGATFTVKIPLSNGFSI